MEDSSIADSALTRAASTPFPSNTRAPSSVSVGPTSSVHSSQAIPRAIVAPKTIHAVSVALHVTATSGPAASGSSLSMLILMHYLAMLTREVATVQEKLIRRHKEASAVEQVSVLVELLMERLLGCLMKAFTVDPGFQVGVGSTDRENGYSDVLIEAGVIEVVIRLIQPHQVPVIDGNHLGAAAGATFLSCDNTTGQ